MKVISSTDGIKTGGSNVGDVCLSSDSMILFHSERTRHFHSRLHTTLTYTYSNTTHVAQHGEDSKIDIPL